MKKAIIIAAECLKNREVTVVFLSGELNKQYEVLIRRPLTPFAFSVWEDGRDEQGEPTFAVPGSLVKLLVSMLRKIKAGSK